VLGTDHFGLGGLSWAVITAGLFHIVQRSLNAGRPSKDRSEQRKTAKGSRRDAGQVLANGGVASAFSRAYRLALSSQSGSGPIACWRSFGLDPPVFRSGFSPSLPSLAAANADTWATGV